jgi:FkbM family methyltransferase
MRDYSQFGEQAIIAKFFEERGRVKGRFLDIGAHDGVSCSNTLALAMKGWGGVLVEPSPLAFTKLITSYEDRPDIEFVNAAVIAGGSALVPFYEGGGSFVGTTDEAHRDAWEGRQHVHYRKMWTNGISFADLFEMLPGPYDLISIDTEGTNFELLNELTYHFNMLHLSPNGLICVEKDVKAAELLAQLIKQERLKVVDETEANILLAQR